MDKNAVFVIFESMWGEEKGGEDSVQREGTTECKDK